MRQFCIKRVGTGKALAAGVLLTGLTGWAQSAHGTEAIETGPEVGTLIPEFELRDQNGQLRNFEDLRGPEGLLLLFHRSADW